MYNIATHIKHLISYLSIVFNLFINIIYNIEINARKIAIANPTPTITQIPDTIIPRQLSEPLPPIASTTKKQIIAIINQPNKAIPS